MGAQVFKYRRKKNNYLKLVKLASLHSWPSEEFSDGLHFVLHPGSCGWEEGLASTQVMKGAIKGGLVFEEVGW